MLSLAEMIDLLVVNGGPFFKKWWREILIMLLSLLLTLAVMAKRDTVKKLTDETTVRTQTETNLKETRDELTMREKQVMLAQSRTDSLEQQLKRAVAVDKRSMPVLLANGQIAYETTEQSKTDEQSSSQEKSTMELHLLEISKEMQDTTDQLTQRSASLQEARQKITDLEKSKSSARHWLAALGMQSNGPTSGTWVGGLGAQMDLGALNFGILVQYPLTGPAPVEARPITGSFIASF